MSMVVSISDHHAYTLQINWAAWRKVVRPLCVVYRAEREPSSWQATLLTLFDPNSRIAYIKLQHMEPLGSTLIRSTETFLVGTKKAQGVALRIQIYFKLIWNIFAANIIEIKHILKVTDNYNVSKCLFLDYDCYLWHSTHNELLKYVWNSDLLRFSLSKAKQSFVLLHSSVKLAKVKQK